MKIPITILITALLTILYVNFVNKTFYERDILLRPNVTSVTFDMESEVIHFNYDGIEIVETGKTAFEKWIDSLRGFHMNLRKVDKGE